MKRIVLLSFLVVMGLLPICAQSEAADVLGYWFMRDLGSKNYVGIIYIYEYNGKIYGRTMVAYDTKTGEVFSYVDGQGDTAKYLIGSPSTMGLDVIWDLEWNEDRGRYTQGSIMDPRKKHHYGAQIWRVGNTLKMRGSLGPFGAAVDWERAEVSDLPEGTPPFRAEDLIPIIYYDEKGKLIPPHNP